MNKAKEEKEEQIEEEKPERIIRTLVEDYYDLQKMRIETENQVRSFIKGNNPTQVKFLKETIATTLKGLENTIKKELENFLQTQPIYAEWLIHIGGIGPILAAGLIAWIRDSKRFATISKLWAYAGLAAGYQVGTCSSKHKIIASSLPVACPILKDNKGGKCEAPVSLIETVTGKVPQAKAGFILLQNRRLKAHMWLIGESFVKHKGGYQNLYKQFRSDYDAKWTSPEQCGGIGCRNKKECLKAHRYQAAKRKTVKVFLAHLFIKWQELQGMPREKPFIIGRNGHEHEIPVVEK